MAKQFSDIRINVFEAALTRARTAFHLHKALPIYDTDQSLAIRYNAKNNTHEIHTTLNISFVHRICEKTGIEIEDACFLALAHEAGHLELNQLCIDAEANPAQSNAQLSAIGIAAFGFLPKILIAECHKETAIEAYCDARLVEAIYKHFPAEANSLVKAVADIRREDSNLPKRFGDDYRTAIIFEAIVSQGFPMPPHEAAKLAFEHSQSSMGHAENIWLTAKRPMLLDFPKAFGELPNKLRTLRDKAFSFSKQPTNNP